MRSHDPTKYHKFKKVDGASYEKVNQFLRKRTFITAREWAISRLCADFQTSSGSEMTFIGQHLPELVPFMTDTYTPQAVNQARHSFKKKVNKSGATFLYGAMCGFYTPEELDDLLFQASEVARFLLEVESTDLNVDEEIEIEDRVTDIMRQVAETSARLLSVREEQQREKRQKAMQKKGNDTEATITDGQLDGEEDVC
ncbi:MAG: hypothetical protein JXA44_12700 [Methanospirillaceae archaeon]|nr:hypothetical protein [Methanospirillaceae archaeon]